MGPYRSSQRGPCVLLSSPSISRASNSHITHATRNVVLQPMHNGRLSETTTHTTITNDDAMPDLVEIEDSDDEDMLDDNADIMGELDDASSTFNTARSLDAEEGKVPKKPPVSSGFHLEVSYTYKLAQVRPVQEWVRHCQEYVDEFVRHNGLGCHKEPPTCLRCDTHIAHVKCQDCFGSVLHCSSCVVESHRNLPFHWVEV